MKKILSLIALFTGIGFLATAQENGSSIPKKTFRHREKVVQERQKDKSPEEMAKIRTERLDSALKFTDKQKQEVYAYHLEQAKKNKERAEAQVKEREALRQEMKADHERFKDLLTPEQQKIMAEKMKNSKGKLMQHRGKDFRKKGEGRRSAPIDKLEGSVEVESSNELG